MPSAPVEPATASAKAAPADLVDLSALAPDVRLDIRYARTDNFTGVAVYPAARCLLRRDVAARVAQVQAQLAAQGLGLLVWDCYRPFTVQERFWALVPDERYVARPVRRDGVPVQGSKHNRGAAIDLTLVGADGVPLEMPTDFDDFSPRAHRDATAASPAAQANARRLEAAMLAAGFSGLPTEWWHYDGPDWQAYPLQ
ncbi:MAG: M15 family metallopeptidase [Deltaproteobacteria bacterium]|nr:M15 family metallopeptidase [Deltaproteobacteria bacterium]